METGLLHLYCGDGKGKTTAAVGLCVRAAGRGLRVRFVQFLKSSGSGERKALVQIPGIELSPCPEKIKFTFQMDAGERRQAAADCARLLESAFQGAENLDLLVLDEVFGALSTGLLNEAEVLVRLKSRPRGLEIVLTGRDPSPGFVGLADYVTEMKKIEHPYARGIHAREGIEY